MSPERVVLLAVRLNVVKRDLVRVIELTNMVLKQETVTQSSSLRQNFRSLRSPVRSDLRIDRTVGRVGEEKHASSKEDSTRNRSIAWHRPSHSTGYSQCRRLRACPLRKITKGRRFASHNDPNSWWQGRRHRI